MRVWSGKFKGTTMKRKEFKEVLMLLDEGFSLTYISKKLSRSIPTISRIRKAGSWKKYLMWRKRDRLRRKNELKEENDQNEEEMVIAGIRSKGSDLTEREFNRGKLALKQGYTHKEVGRLIRRSETIIGRISHANDFENYLERKERRRQRRLQELGKLPETISLEGKKESEQEDILMTASVNKTLLKITEGLAVITSELSQSKKVLVEISNTLKLARDRGRIKI